MSPRYGAVSSAECKKDYILLRTDRGEAVYGYDGRVPWSRLRAELMERLHESFRRRVKFEILLFRYRGGGSGRGGARGRVYVDGEVVGAGLYNRGDFTTSELGKAVADYLDLSPAEAFRSHDDLVSAISLLDSDFDPRLLGSVTHRDHPVWNAFYQLRVAMPAS